MGLIDILDDEVKGRLARRPPLLGGPGIGGHEPEARAAPGRDVEIVVVGVVLAVGEAKVSA